MAKMAYFIWDEWRPRRAFWARGPTAIRLLWAPLVLVVSACSVAEQPIPFNHKLHVTRGSLVCESCHETVFEQTFAGLPPIRICMRCHKSENPEDAVAAQRVEQLRSYAKAGGDVPWQRVYRMPPFVFFSHRRHTEVGDVACDACHGAMGEMTSPPTGPEGDTLTMSGCIDCHQKRKVTTDCDACHR